MKKYLYLAAFCLLLGPTVSAQNDADKGIEFPHRVVTNGFWDNWFVGSRRRCKRLWWAA